MVLVYLIINAGNAASLLCAVSLRGKHAFSGA